MWWADAGDGAQHLVTPSTAFHTRNWPHIYPQMSAVPRWRTPAFQDPWFLQTQWFSHWGERLSVYFLHRHFSAFNRTGQPNIMKKLNTTGMCRLMNYSAPGYSHNHQSGPKVENCQELRTAPTPPSPRGPYPRGHLFFPHSSDLAPRFSLSITIQIFKHFCLNYFRTLCVWSVHSFLSFGSLIILLGSLDATAPSCKRQQGHNGLIAKENVSVLPH